MPHSLKSLLKTAGCFTASTLWLAGSACVAASPLSWLEGSLLLGITGAALARPVLGSGWWHGRHAAASRRR